MKTFIWRHNRRMHSWSMINEPVVHIDFYTDAVIIVQAETLEQAWAIVAARGDGWNADELRRLSPQIIDDDQPGVIFADVKGD